MELVGLVNDKKCNKQPCQKATITEDRNSEHTMQDYEYCFYSDHHHRDGCGIRYVNVDDHWDNKNGRKIPDCD